MKSAYELAIERLEKAKGPAPKLTDEQRAKIADINAIYDAKTAHLRLTHEAEMGNAASYEQAQQAQAKLSEELAELERRREQEKQEVWTSAQP